MLKRANPKPSNFAIVRFHAHGAMAHADTKRKIGKSLWTFLNRKPG